MSIIDEIRAMSPEEQVELGNILEAAKKKAEYQNLEPKQLGEPMDLRPRDERGKLLTDEEIWDKEHPLIRLPYGFSHTYTDLQGVTATKVWTRAEIDAHNKPIEEDWLAEKRKVFPDAELPPNADISGRMVYKNPHR